MLLNNHRHRFNLRISTLVEEEICRGDDDAAKRRLSWVAEIASLGISDEATELARQLIAEGVLAGVRTTRCTSPLPPLRARISS